MTCRIHYIRFIALFAGVLMVYGSVNGQSNIRQYVRNPRVQYGNKYINPERQQQTYTKQEVRDIVRGLLTHQTTGQQVPVKRNPASSARSQDRVTQKPLVNKPVKRNAVEDYPPYDPYTKPVADTVKQNRVLVDDETEDYFVKFKVSLIEQEDRGDTLIRYSKPQQPEKAAHPDPSLPAKRFRITEDGKYAYKDGKPVYTWGRRERKNDGYKPITVRTFYLETRRLGLLPDTLDYRTFKSMSPEEQRRMFMEHGMKPYEPVLAESDLTPSAADSTFLGPATAQTWTINFNLVEVMTFKYRDEGLVDRARREYMQSLENEPQNANPNKRYVLERNDERWLLEFNILDVLTHQIDYEKMNTKPPTVKVVTVNE